MKEECACAETPDRVAALLLVLMISAAALGVLGSWLTVGRRGAATSPGLSK